MRISEIIVENSGPSDKKQQAHQLMMTDPELKKKIFDIVDSIAKKQQGVSSGSVLEMFEKKYPGVWGEVHDEILSEFHEEYSDEIPDYNNRKNYILKNHDLDIGDYMTERLSETPQWSKIYQYLESENSKLAQDPVKFIKKHGLSSHYFEDIFHEALGKINKSVAKYFGPNGETWSGRGLKPKWLSDLLKAGHSIEEFQKLSEH